MFKFLYISALYILSMSTISYGQHSDDSDDLDAEFEHEMPRRKHDRMMGKGHSKRLAKHNRVFSEADVNNDSALSLGEFSKLKRMAHLKPEEVGKLYDFLDRDNDGQLSLNEVKPPLPIWKSVLLKNFAAIDTDESDDISFDEFTSANKLMHRKRRGARHLFDHIDSNRDSLLEFNEIRGADVNVFGKKLSFKELDKDKDGGISLEEYSEIPMMNKLSESKISMMFDRVDLDENGWLTEKELDLKRKGRRRDLLPE